MQQCVSRSFTGTFLWRSNCGQEETRCEEESSQEDCQESPSQEGHEEESPPQGKAQDQEGLAHWQLVHCVISADVRRPIFDETPPR